MDWSHALLDDDERRLFHRLAFFTDGFDLDAATAVAADGDAALASDAVGRLADKSLLVHRRDETGSRWRMLETVHAYGREQLEASGEVATIADRHLEWAAARAVALEAAIDDSAAWHPAIDAVVDDLRTALGTAGARGPEPCSTPWPERSDTCSTHAASWSRLGRRSMPRIALAPTEGEAVSAMRVAAGAAHAAMLGDQAFELLVAASARAEAAGDRSAAAIALADAAAFAGRAPGTIEQEHAPTELDAMIEHARRLAPGDLEAAAHVASAEAWTSHPGTAVADPVLAVHALDLARQIDDPVRISDALDAVSAADAAEGRLRGRVSKHDGAPHRARSPRPPRSARGWRAVRPLPHDQRSARRRRRPHRRGRGRPALFVRSQPSACALRGRPPRRAVRSDGCVRRGARAGGRDAQRVGAHRQSRPPRG